MPQPEEPKFAQQSERDTTSELEQLKKRYLDRLADIAELGHDLSRKEKELGRLKAQHADWSLRYHVLSQLRPVHTKLHIGLTQKYRLLARRRLKKMVAKDMQLIAGSGFFDAEWYLANNPDIAKSGVDPLRHYVLDGAYELRDPGPQFSAFRYHKAYPDVTAGAVPALMHFLRNGRTEGRTAFRVEESG